MTFQTGAPHGAALVPSDPGWTLVFVRELRHRPDRVWRALTDPAEIDRWAPYAAARPLTSTGETTLTMIDGDERMDLPATVRIAEAPRLLEVTWGDDVLRWELEPSDTGTMLTLRHSHPAAEAGMPAMVAAGWHLCAVVLERLLDGRPVGVIRGRAAMAHGWEELREGYAKEFG